METERGPKTVVAPSLRTVPMELQEMGTPYLPCNGGNTADAWWVSTALWPFLSSLSCLLWLLKVVYDPWPWSELGWRQSLDILLLYPSCRKRKVVASGRHKWTRRIQLALCVGGWRVFKRKAGPATAGAQKRQGHRLEQIIFSDTLWNRSPQWAAKRT